jgi:hypothetical protein
MTDDLEWFIALPGPVQAALRADPGAALPSGLIARLPRLYRSRPTAPRIRPLGRGRGGRDTRKRCGTSDLHDLASSDVAAQVD